MAVQISWICSTELITEQYGLLAFFPGTGRPVKSHGFVVRRRFCLKSHDLTVRHKILFEEYFCVFENQGSPN